MLEVQVMQRNFNLKLILAFWDIEDIAAGEAHTVVREDIIDQGIEADLLNRRIVPEDADPIELVIRGVDLIRRETLNLRDLQLTRRAVLEAIGLEFVSAQFGSIAYLTGIAVEIEINDLVDVGIAILDLTILEDDSGRTEVTNTCHIMTNEEDCSALALGNVFHLTYRFLLELRIADG